MEQSILQDALIKILSAPEAVSDSALTRAEKVALSLIRVATTGSEQNKISAFQTIDFTLARIFDR